MAAVPCQRMLCATRSTRTRHHHCSPRRKEANEVAFLSSTDAAKSPNLPKTHSVGLRLRLYKADAMETFAPVVQVSCRVLFMTDEVCIAIGLLTNV